MHDVIVRTDQGRCWERPEHEVRWRGIQSEKGGVGSCVIVRTSRSTLTRTWMLQPAAHRGKGYGVAYCLLLGRQPGQHVAVPNTAGDYNIMVFACLNIYDHRKGTGEIGSKG